MDKQKMREKNRIAAAKYRKNHPDRASAASAKWKATHPQKAKETRKIYRATHMEEERRRDRERYKKNPTRSKSAIAAWNAKHPGRAKELGAAWASKNIEKENKRKAEWIKNNPKKMRIIYHNKRARKKANGGGLSPGVVEKLLVFQKNRCAICRASLKKIGYHLDHIVPLARGGKNIDSNAQLACPTCNMQKNAKDPIAFMQSRGYLL
jgi:5-methylcytosine-specific restriction endonuclease McrA